MAGEVNGRSIDPSITKGSPNGHAVARSPQSTESPKFVSTCFSWLARISLWYVIATALFRCPSSFDELSESSPAVCQPYLNVRSLVAPHVEPYYQSYAAPHVEKLRPYVERFNEQIFTPTVQFGKQTYEVHGAPRVDQAREYSQDQWEKLLKPQIDTAQLRFKEQYDSNLAPHVSKASAAVGPYYTASRNNVLKVYDNHLFPVYRSSRPYAENAYGLVKDTGLPYAQSIWSSSVVFFDRMLWPKIRILYGENVEPQLVRIGERLGRYRDGKRLQAAMDDLENSSQASYTSVSVSSMSSPLASVVATSQTAAAASPSLTPEQEAEQTREKIESDLQKWQDKFAKAADKGIEDLEERAREITRRQIESQVLGVGEALVIQLEESARSEEIKLKKSIRKIVTSLPTDSTEEEIGNAQDKLSKAARAAAMSVKEKAQALRSWKEKYDRETQSLLSAASESTLEVIDNIRDLGLQEIGMRWAWMEGVTYKDWSKYHEVKKTFDDWRQGVVAVAQDHKGLRTSKNASEELEFRGMAIAEHIAKELGRLKDVGKWKIQAHDDSDDFSTKYMPPAAAVASQKVLEQASSASEQVIGTSQGTVESFLSGATQMASNAGSAASSQIIGTEPGVIEQANSMILEGVSVVSNQASEAVIGTPQPASESIVSAAKDRANQMASGASEKIIGTPPPVYKSVASQISEKANSAATDISDALSTKTVSSSASSVVSHASNKVYGGAMAQEVKGQEPILDDVFDDDDSTYSEKLQSMVNHAGETYADVTKAVSEAIMKATTTQGSVESASSVADEQYSKALSAASSVLYGTQQGTVESATSVASEKWAEAVAAASSMIYETPAPMTESAASAASSAYSDAINRAKAHYSHARSIVSAQISGTPKPVHEEMFSSVENAYSDSLAAASQHLQNAVNAASTALYGTPLSPQQSAKSIANAKYSDAMAAASSQLDAAKTAVGATSTPGYEKFISDASQRYSSLIGVANAQYASATDAAISGPSQGVFESITAMASSKLADSLQAASAQYSSIKTAVGATPTPVHQQVLMDGQRRYYEAVGLAHDRYSEFIKAASTAVYGTPTPAYQNFASVASDSLFGTPTPAYQSMLDNAQRQYSDVVAQASEKLQLVLDSASTAVGKTSKSPAQSVLDSASSQYSAALSIASASLSAASAAASTGIHGTSTGMVESMGSVIAEKADSISSAASTGIYGSSTGIVESMGSVIVEKADSISSAASTAVVGSETPWSESMASQASENWEALVSKASEQIYGAPTPFSQSVISQAGGYAAQVTDTAAAQYEAVQALLSELISGKEPDFTESVMNRLSSAYYTGAHASVAALSFQLCIFTPPATLEAIIAAANEQVNAAVEAASAQVYGTTKGTYEQATSAAAASASSASSRISEAVYGTQAGYMESVQSSLNDVAASASDAISAAIYGTTGTGATTSISNAAGNAYASVSSVVADSASRASEAVDATKAKISEVVYGPEQGALESAQRRILEAVESAKSRMAEMGSSIGSAASRATGQARDEL